MQTNILTFEKFLEIKENSNARVDLLSTTLNSFPKEANGIAEGCGMDINSVKGIVASLMKKDILRADRFTGGDGKKYECFYFTDQENLQF